MATTQHAPPPQTSLMTGMLFSQSLFGDKYQDGNVFSPLQTSWVQILLVRTENQKEENMFCICVSVHSISYTNAWR